MEFLTALCVCFLALPNMAIAQINRDGGENVSNLGSIYTDTNKKASKLCRERGGNLVVKVSDGWYICYYAQQLADRG
jgi:hypothetical protein